MAVLMVDLDGTLVDRSEVVRDWATHVAQRFPEDTGLVDWLIAWDMTDTGVRDRREFLTGVRDRLGLPDSVDELVARWPSTFGSQYRLDDATRRALSAVRKTGIPVVIVTNGPITRQQAKLDAMQVQGVVDSWVISEQVGVCKPDRRIFEMAAETVGQTLDGSWMIGDDPVNDMAGAADTGLRCAWVNRHGQRWPGPAIPPPSFPHPAPAISFAAAAILAP